jgi:diguanylate cyclase (GGDEF)-like protein
MILLSDRWLTLPSMTRGILVSMEPGGRELQRVADAAAGPGTAPDTVVRIGFVGTGTSAGLVDSLAALLPPMARLDVLSIPEAARQIGAHALAVLIIAVDTPSWRQAIIDLHSVIAAAKAYPLAVFALVPRNDPAALVKAFELRVADAAGLPIDPHEVRARLAALVRRRRVADAKAAETRTAWQLAVIDPVTGLFNRHHLAAVLPAEFDSARRLGQSLAVMMIDLDGLKVHNDKWGHAAGDDLLRNVARAIVAGMRPTDTIARYGGDEIVVVMPDTSPEMARALAARLVQLVASREDGSGQASPGQPPAMATVSIGLAICAPGDEDADALLRRADAALYAAKNAGRNRMVSAA